MRLAFRLSDGYALAVPPFTADGPRALRDACRVALVGAAAHLTLELHVQDERGDWCAPTQPLPNIPDAIGRPVRVLVSAQLLDLRPADDWTDIWLWCEHAASLGRLVRGRAVRAANDALPPAELGDADRD